MMTAVNIGDMLDLLEITYGKKVIYAESTREKIISLWGTMFSDDDPAEVAIAVKDCIATLQYAPKIADIKTRIAKQKMSKQMTEMEAWQTVARAIESAVGYNESLEAFRNLPPTIQKLIGSYKTLRDWRSIEKAQLNTVVMSGFVRSYREEMQKQYQYYTLPADIQKQSQHLIEAPNLELPAPKVEKTMDEAEEEQDLDAIEYRRKYLIPEYKQYWPEHYANLVEKGVCG